jgi:opacity protein-like surface antigen
MKSWILLGVMCAIAAAPVCAQTAASVADTSGAANLSIVAAGSSSDGSAASIANSAAVTSPGLLAAPDASALAEPSTPPASELPRWQFWFGFQGVRYEEFRGGPVGNAISDYDFWTFGPNFTITHFFNKWLGLDGGFTPGFGHTTAGSHLVTQSYDFGVGPRFALRGRHRVEPFVRTSIGMLHFHFDNSGALPETLNSFEFAAGAGTGFKLTKKIWWTLEADYVGTHFFSNNQKDVEMRSQVVFNF